MNQGGDRLRVVYFGSPEFATPPLEALLRDGAYDVALVVTQGEKGPSPVERAAVQAGLPIYKPQSLRDAASRQPLVEARADLFVVAAFGLIFRQRTLDLPRLGAINVHPSLLPKYRGASPIAAAIASGDRETGVSLMLMDAGIDTGAVISQVRATLASDDTAESMSRKLANIAADQVVRDVPRWVNGTLIPEPQSTVGASLTRTLVKADGWVDWRRPAVELERHVRAMWPWPRAWTSVDATTMQIHQARVLEIDGQQEPGTVIPDRKRIVIACGQGALELLVVEPAGRKPMSALAYLNGRRSPLVRLGATDAPPPVPPLVRPVA